MADVAFVIWASVIQQHNNKRTTPMLTYKGETKPLMYWARELNIKPVTLRGRLNTGWTVDEALSLPADPNHRDPRGLK